MPKKYAHINFTPPQDVQAAARRGLALRRKFGRGGLSRKEASAQGIGSGVQRATNLANGDKVSPETIGRMVSFFARHEKNKDSKTPSGEPGAGQISWLLWGGTPGQRWATKVKRQMEAADMKNKSLATLAQQILVVRGKMETAPQNGEYIEVRPSPEVKAVIEDALVQKIGARHTGAECALIQKIHDLAIELGAECHPLTHRAGARHSHADQGMVQRIHDDCAGLGAECKALPEKDRVYSSQVLKDGEIVKGSAGSGNFGHDGRPGRKGGSSKGGGLRRIGAKKDSKPGARKRAAKKFREKRKQDKTLSDVPKDLTKMSKKQRAASVEKLSKLPLGELRKRQDLNDKQIKIAFDSRNTPALNNLRVREGILAEAVDKKEFGSKPKRKPATKKPAKKKGSKSLDLNTREKRALGAFKKESSLGVDISSIPGAVKGKNITKVGADTVNGLLEKKLIRQTSLIGPSGFPRMKATDLGREALEKKAALALRAQSDAPNYAPASTPQRCENCAFFLGDPGEDWCERFEFTADPDYHCDAWEAGKPDEIPGYEANKADLATLIEGVLILRGGPTSGNWGHSGRPGKKGGSGSGGGFRRIGVKTGASRKQVKRAAKKKGKPKVTKPAKPQAKPKTSKLDDIFNKAPKGSQDSFSNHLIDKMLKGEMSLKDAQTLTARFKEKQGGAQKATSPKTGDVKSAKTFTEAELRNGAAKKQWGGWSKKLSGQEKDALKAYSSEPFDELATDYIKMNNHLRGKDKNPSKETRDTIRRVDSAINKGSIPQDTTVFRGFPASILGDDPAKIVGKTITDKAYTSSSMSERVASQFSKDLIAEIKIPKGSKGAFMDATLTKGDLDQLGRDPEHELLLPRNSKFRVLGTKKIGAKTKVFMELMNG